MGLGEVDFEAFSFYSVFGAYLLLYLKKLNSIFSRLKGIDIRPDRHVRKSVLAYARVSD